jgi:hypothetical protein
MTARGIDALVDAEAGQRHLRAVARPGKLADRTVLKLVPSTRRFFHPRENQRRADVDAFPQSDRQRSALVGRADREISKILLHAIMRDTIAPVIMNAGFRNNVIPGSADHDQHQVDPRSDPMDMVGEIQRVIADPDRRQASASACLPPHRRHGSFGRWSKRRAGSSPALMTPLLFQAGTMPAHGDRAGFPYTGSTRIRSTRRSFAHARQR